MQRAHLHNKMPCQRLEPQTSQSLCKHSTTELFFFFVGCFTCAPDSFELVYWVHGTDLCVGCSSIVEWINLVTGKKLHWT